MPCELDTGFAYSPHDVKVKMAGNELADRIVHHVPITCIELRLQLEQHVAALEVKLASSRFIGRFRQNIGAGMTERWMLALNEKLED